MNDASMNSPLLCTNGGGFLPGLERLIVKRWEEWDLPGPAPQGLSFILMGHYPVRHKVVLCIPHGARRAVVVGKVSRRWDGLAWSLRHEHQLLRELRPQLPEALRANVPRPLYHGLCAGEELILATALEGRVLWERVGRDHTWGGGGRVRRHLVQCGGWLLRLHQATRRPWESGEAWEKYRRKRMAVLRGVREVHRLSPLTLELLDHTEREFGRVKEWEIPLVCEHGDYWMGNVLLGDSGLGIVDWEEGRRVGLPLLDLFMLLHSTAVLRRNQSMEHGRLLRAYERSHFQESWLSDVAERFLRQYALAVGVSREAARPLFPLFLAQLATREYAATGVSGALDSFWRDCLEVFAERRSQFGWLEAIPGASELADAQHELAGR